MVIKSAAWFLIPWIIYKGQGGGGDGGGGEPVPKKQGTIINDMWLCMGAKDQDNMGPY
jgi:hypothetical protein